MTTPPASGRRVVVVGGGPSGLLLAGIVATAGVPVTLLEARRTPNLQVRASTLHARAMEILSWHGVPGLATLPRSSTGHYVGLPLDLSAARSTWAGAWRCQQPDLMRRLRAWARTRGVLTVSGARVSGIAQDESRVSVWTDTGRSYEGEVLVAADGVHSELRAHLGVTCAGPAPARSMVRADMRGTDLQQRRFERLGDLTATCAPLDARTTRVMLHDPSWPVGQVVEEDRLRTAWRSATGEHLPARIQWVDTFSDDTSWAREVRVGRVVFCGDAAQQFIPIAGVALNSALIAADALAHSLTGHRPSPSLVALDEYSRNAVVLARDTAQRLQQEARLIFGLESEVAEERNEIAARLRLDDQFRERIVQQVSGLASPTNSSFPTARGRQEVPS